MLKITDFRSLANPISEKEFLLFREYIMKHSGISIAPEKSYLIETRLSKLMTDSGTDSFSDFYEYIMSMKDPLMPQKIINAITINETSWFRDDAPWMILENILLPKLIDELTKGNRTQVRIWSAAASTGQEIYSTAMCIDNYLRKEEIKGVDLSDFEFFATDISSHVLDIAKKGRYNSISIKRGLSYYYKTEYFVEDDAAWDIAPKIKNAVKFERFNLQNSYYALGKFDIIFCRYVLIYFSDSQKKEVIAKMHDALNENGVFFTGNYALYDMFTDNYNANYYGNLTYYTKKGG